MFPKKNRLDTKTVEKVFKMGTFTSSQNLTLRFLKSKNNTLTRISFIVPKNVAKKASERNALRRKGYRALKGAFPRFPSGLVGAIVFKKPILGVEIKNEIETLLNKIN